MMVRMMLDILIRVDASSNIGMGHMMRMYALIDQVKEQANISVMVKTFQAKKFFISKGYEVFWLPGLEDVGRNKDTYDYGSEGEQLEEVAILDTVINDRCYDYIVIDSYNISQDYINAYRCHGKVVLVEDRCDSPYMADVKLNYNIYAPSMWVADNADTVSVLGTDYYCARREFLRAEPMTINDNINSVVITTGGADPYGISYHLAGELANIKSIQDIHVVVGNGLADVTKLKHLSDRFDKVKLHIDSIDVAKVFGLGDVVISTAGSTLYELSVLGIPTLSIVVADNQKLIAQAMDQEGLAVYVGDVRINDLELINKQIVGQLRKMSKKIREKQSIDQQKLCDGKGGPRILEILEKEMKNDSIRKTEHRS